MDDHAALVRTGLAGAAVAAVCCATPVLVVALAAGVAGAAVWLDWLLVPALIGFVAIACVEAYRLCRPAARSADRL